MVDGIKIGDVYSLKRSFSEEDVARYAELTGDDNPVHLDDDFARSTVFERRIVHGMLVSSLFSTILGSKLPSRSVVYLGQTLTFKLPVYIDEKVRSTVEITNVREDKPIIIARSLCHNSKGEIAIEGEAVIKVLT